MIRFENRCILTVKTSISNELYSDVSDNIGIQRALKTEISPALRALTGIGFFRRNAPRLRFMSGHTVIKRVTSNKIKGDFNFS